MKEFVGRSNTHKHTHRHTHKAQKHKARLPTFITYQTKYALMGVGRWTTSKMFLDFRDGFDTWTMNKLVVFILLIEHYMSSAFIYYEF